jgi:hypothetical protein
LGIKLYDSKIGGFRTEKCSCGIRWKICSIAFVISITDALKACAALPRLTQFTTVFHLPGSSRTLL